MKRAFTLSLLAAAVLATGCTRIETGEVGVRVGFDKQVQSGELLPGSFNPVHDGHLTLARVAEDIAQQVTAIQGSTQQAVTAVNEVSKVITEISQIAAMIASAVEEQGAATREISRNVQEAANGTREVSANISDVTRAAAETGEAAERVRTAADGVAGKSGELRHEVETFLTGVKAA